MDRTKSDQLHTEALSHLVGGVNSPVRAFKSVHGNPIYFEKASGAHVTDVDGNVLVDFVQSWGPLIHGHSHPEIIEAVHEKMLNGTSFGAPHLGEIELAKRVKQRFPHLIVLGLGLLQSNDIEATVVEPIHKILLYHGPDTVDIP